MVFKIDMQRGYSRVYPHSLQTPLNLPYSCMLSNSQRKVDYWRRRYSAAPLEAAVWAPPYLEMRSVSSCILISMSILVLNAGSRIKRRVYSSSLWDKLGWQDLNCKPFSHILCNLVYVFRYSDRSERCGFSMYFGKKDCRFRGDRSVMDGGVDIGGWKPRKLVCPAPSGSYEYKDCFL